MAERLSPGKNLCTEASCPAACCRNTWIPSLKEDREVERLFPQATKVHTYNLGETFPIGVYWTDFSDRHILIRIVGKCPHLDKNYNCTIYNDGKPEACEKMKLGGADCRDFRKEKPTLSKKDKPKPAIPGAVPIPLWAAEKLPFSRFNR